MIFISSYDVRPEPFFQPDSSSGIEDIYEKRVDKSGRITFEKTGEKNVYEEIQSFKDDTDINFIISRCVKDGTVSLLADDGKRGVDISMLPDNFIDLYNMTLALQEEFKSLPLEERELFGQSPLAYVDERINGTAIDKVTAFRNKANEPVNEDAAYDQPVQS